MLKLMNKLKDIIQVLGKKNPKIQSILIQKKL